MVQYSVTENQWNHTKQEKKKERKNILATCITAMLPVERVPEQLYIYTKGKGNACEIKVWNISLIYCICS